MHMPLLGAGSDRGRHERVARDRAKAVFALAERDDLTVARDIDLDRDNNRGSEIRQAGILSVMLDAEHRTDVAPSGAAAP